MPHDKRFSSERRSGPVRLQDWRWAPDRHRLRWRRGLLGFLGVALLICAHGWIWGIFQTPPIAPDIRQPLSGLAYNAYDRWGGPGKKDGDGEQHAPAEASIARDLALIAPLSSRIRTYSATELPMLPALAKEQGLSITLGAWLDQNRLRNQAEVQAVMAAVKAHKNIDRLILGNETQLTKKLPAEELYKTLDQVRRQLRTPVSTAEPWHVWLSQPALAQHVDFITVHLLPYWEKIPADQAVAYALARLDDVQRRFPRLPIVIGEVGWPSHGPAQGPAIASPENQALFIRTFVAQAKARGLDFYLMEAIDQPWKRSIEGQAGAHWGLWDAHRQAKFPLSGPLEISPQAKGKAFFSSLVGLAMALPFLFGLPALRPLSRLMVLLGSQAVVVGMVAFSAWPFADYLEPVDGLRTAGLIVSLLFLGLLMVSQLFEFAETFWPERLHRDHPTSPWQDAATAPKVSIHLACSNEPPSMVIDAIQNLLRLNWPALEVIVVDNNTREASLWRPIADFVAETDDPRLQFFHLPNWPGFKAGALNFALHQTDPEAAWIGVVDADYLVAPDWLEKVSGYFDDPRTGLIQAPQAHRDPLSQPFSRMAYWEYEGFFRVGMHHRHQRNAIVQHGTMTLIRAQTLRGLGGWDPSCICEDSELGLRIMAEGLKAVYIDTVFGRGLLPDDFSSYRRQRRRWAQGAMQILKIHWKRLLGPSALTPSQRYHFLAGWLPWIGDGLHLVFTLGAIGWSLGVLIAPLSFPLPNTLLLMPLAGFMAFRLLMGLGLYLRHVPCPRIDILGASLAGLGLSHVIARGLLSGLVHKTAIFEITRKKTATGLDVMRRSDTRKIRQSATLEGTPLSPTGQQLLAVREELILGLCLIGLSLLIWQAPSAALDLDRKSWSAVLLLQALPYLAALSCALISARGQSSAQNRETALTGAAHRVRWASPESQRSVLTADVAPQNPPHPH
ncbi:MAG: Cellulose synthase 1 [Pseudomonadota bacterium]